eukprot:6894975-Alexandrium_andersonii.AAC.1
MALGPSLLCASGHLEADAQLHVNAAEVGPGGSRQGLQPAGMACSVSAPLLLGAQPEACVIGELS